jgi:RecT family
MTDHEITPMETRITERISPDKAMTLKVDSAFGGLVIRDMSQLMEFSKMMAVANFYLPKHLRGNPGACMGVIMQAIEWKMSPFAVANKSYLVNDRISYEAQLIHGVILIRAPIKGRVIYTYQGEGPTRRCTVSAPLNYRGGGTVEYTSPEIGKIPVQNSPLWKNDPDQQLGYYAVRAWARRHFPDVIMGVYEREEMRYNAIEGEATEVVEEKVDKGNGKNPLAPRSAKNLKAKLESLAEDKPAEDPTPRSPEPIEDNAATREGVVGDEADEDEDDETEEVDGPVREADQMFERLRPAAERGPKALKLAIGKLSAQEVMTISETVHERLDEIAIAAKKTSAPL